VRRPMALQTSADVGDFESEVGRLVSLATIRALGRRMALYTFYCCRADGAATAFEAHDLRSDKAARERAERLLADHASSAAVVA
jgi:hypothetical protein